MKKLLIGILSVILTIGVFAQTPQKMSYQAVIRNSSSALVTNHTIGMRISILQGSETGNVVYTETITPSTNANGLVSVEIGGGIGFDNIDWSTGTYYIKTETDPTGGTNYNIVGTSRLLTVPYALHTKTAEIALSGDYNNLFNRPTLFDGNYNSLTNLPILFNGSYNSLLDKPTLFDGAFTSLTGKPTTLNGYGITNAMSTSHPANEITENNKQYWNLAHSWGNHADAGYLKTFTELDPYFNQWFSLTGNDDARPYDYMGWDGTKWVRTRNTFAKSDHQHDLVLSFGVPGFMDPADKLKLDGYPTPTTVGDFMAYDGLNWVIKNTTNFAGATHSHGLVTSTAHGFMSNADKIKLDSFTSMKANGALLVCAEDKWELLSGDYYATSNHGHSVATTLSSGFMSNLDKTKLDGLTAADGSETKINASTGITVKGNGTIATPYSISMTQHTVGETYGGGVIFYVWDNGYHGLIASVQDATINGQVLLPWNNPNGNAAASYAGALANGVGAGKTNTAAMLAMNSRLIPSAPAYSIHNAAYAVALYQAQDAAGVRYADWYVPSAFEMILMMQSTATIPNFFKENYYWSSTETPDQVLNAYMVVYGNTNLTDKRNTYRVRPIRSF